MSKVDMKIIEEKDTLLESVFTLLLLILNYLSSIIAPAASNSAFTFSASSFETASFILAPAVSTNSLASFNPNPVIALTVIITSNF